MDWSIWRPPNKVKAKQQESNFSFKMKLVFLLTFIFFTDFSGAFADLVIEAIEVESNVLLGQGIQDGERLQVQPDGEVHIFLILVHSCVSQSP